jgi:hypothetical protein
MLAEGTLSEIDITRILLTDDPDEVLAAVRDSALQTHGTAVPPRRAPALRWLREPTLARLPARAKPSSCRLDDARESGST